MDITMAEIVNDLRRLGINPGDTLIVHSSLKSLGRVEGGADTVIDALLAALRPGGTLLMPSFQHGSEFFLLDRGCCFDVRSSPSECGIITETFRKRSGVLRSLSPTHCVAGCGPLAEHLLAKHAQCRISTGHGSPFHHLAEAGGKILLLGVTHASNTSLHYVENINGAPTICRKEYYPVVIDRDGVKITVPTLPHMPGLPRNYARVEPLLLQAGVQINGRIGQAEARLILAGAMAALIGAHIRNAPLFLIEPFVFDESGADNRGTPN